MIYRGKYQLFDPSRITTYPLLERTNKVRIADMILPRDAVLLKPELSPVQTGDVDELAGHIFAAREDGKPVTLFAGGHLIKNGLGKLAADLVERKVFTLVGGQGATAIHDFELALIGETSEDVPKGLEEGRFGMAYEFSFFNTALQLGNRLKLGFGESLGKLISDSRFRAEVLELCSRESSPKVFAYPEISLLRTCYEHNVPFTVHAGIGTDVADQHPSFDGEAKGGCSGRDFLIFVEHISRFEHGGVALNIGSAVTGPEVLLKAVSMAANTGKAPKNIITADFDLRKYEPQKVADESSAAYYMRDQKSVVKRIPAAYHGRGYYILGDQKDTFVYLYQKIVEKCCI